MGAGSSSCALVSPGVPGSALVAVVGASLRAHTHSSGASQQFDVLPGDHIHCFLKRYCFSPFLAGLTAPLSPSGESFAHYPCLGRWVLQSPECIKIPV